VRDRGIVTMVDYPQIVLYRTTSPMTLTDLLRSLWLT